MGGGSNSPAPTIPNNCHSMARFGRIKVKYSTVRFCTERKRDWRDETCMLAHGHNGKHNNGRERWESDPDLDLLPAIQTA